MFDVEGMYDYVHLVFFFVKMPPKMFKLIALKQQIEDDLKKSVDILREHKQMKPFLLKMIQKDISYV